MWGCRSIRTYKQMIFSAVSEPQSTTWKSPFRHPWWEPYRGVGDRMLSKDEWTILKISSAIREKPGWKSKSRDNTIVEKWRSELRDQFKNDTKYIDDILDYVFKELQWYELVESDFKGVQEAGFVMGCDDRIIHSETAIPSDLKEALRKAVDKFVESEFSDGVLDYHPGSNNQVVDLVHPSLYPVQYGKTVMHEASTVDKPAYRRRNSDEPAPPLKIVKFDENVLSRHKSVPEYATSKKFQWLPALMSLTSQYEKDGYKKGYAFASYINNLPPDGNEELYDTLSEVFNKSIPGLNLCLSRFKSPTIERINYPSYGQFYNEEYDQRLDAIENKYDVEGDDYEAYDDALEELENEKGKYLREFKPVWNKPYPVDYTFDVSNSFPNLNVIVKLANIELTPENPTYKGGSWHVEGTINENIIATILYYYDSDNISESRLSFKAAFEDPEYEQSDYVGCREVYGLEDLDSMQKEIGSIECKEDRVLIFPNWFQHHVDPFELNDKTKKGHRKIVCFFICDPYNSKVINSSQVPPQQKAWWESKDNLQGFEKIERADVEKLLGDDAFISLDAAKKIREELMEERSVPEDDDEPYLKPFVREFSLCEH